MGTPRRVPFNTRFFAALVLAILLAGSASEVAPLLGQDVPRPGEGGGIRESLADIMARDARERAQGRSSPPARDRWRRFHLPRPALPPTPPKAAELAPRPILPKSPQTAGTSFLASQTSESLGIYPLDAMGAVGPTQILLCTNALIKVFDRSGTAEPSVLDTPTDTFFTSVRTAGTSVTDVRVRFDVTSQRWFVMALDGDAAATKADPFPGANNHFVLAVSSGPTLSSSASFTFFRFTAGTASLQADSDAVGIDHNAIYIGVSEFDSTGSLNSCGAFVVQKSSVLGAGPLVVTSFPALATLSAAAGNPIVGTYLPNGVDNDDLSATFGYFVGPDLSSLATPAFSTKLRVHRVVNPGSLAPTLDPVQLVTVPAFGNSYEFDVGSGVPVQGSNPGLDDIDNRLTIARIQGGVLWTVHNIDVDASGNATFSGNRDGARWYAIANLDTTPTLSQTGTLFDSSSGASSYFVPSLAVSDQGHLALGATRGGPSEYASAVAAGRLSGDPAGTIQSATVLAAGVSSYNFGAFDPSFPFRRWGDYTYTCVDPGDRMTMWTFQEYTNGKDSMGIQVSQLLAPPPATPSLVSPAWADSGQAAVSVTLTATSAEGSGFFDPSAVYPKHLSASASGGVTVASVIYTDPLHLTLQLDTTAAPPGPISITITNPDGQSVTATGLFTVTSPAAAAATVTGLTSTLAPGTYGAGTVVPVIVTFSSPVTVTGGTPTLALNVSPMQSATYTGGSGTPDLVFTYTVAPGDTSAALDAASTQSLAAAGASVQSAAGAADLTLPAPGGPGSLPSHDALGIGAAPAASSSHHQKCGLFGLEAALAFLLGRVLRGRQKPG